MPTIRGVIFDLDGTLVDSNEAHVLAWVDALAEFDWTVTQEQVRPLIGMGGDKLLPALIGIADDSPEGRPLVRRRDHLMARVVPTLRPFPGAQALVEALHERGLRLAVEAEHSKPDPDIVAAARAALGLAASEVVKIGDTRYDLEASRRSRCAAATAPQRCWRSSSARRSFDRGPEP